MLLSAFVGAVGASAAQAVEAPFWQVEGSRLGSGQSKEFLMRAEAGGLTNTTEYVLAGPKGTEKVKCTKEALEKGSLIGSAAGEPGKSEEVIEFRGCSVTGNGASCTKVEEPIKTAVLKEEEVLNTGQTAVLGYYTPVNGTRIATIEFLGEGCTFKETEVDGSLAGNYLTDGSSEGLLGAGEAKSWLIEFPSGPITAVSLVKSGTGKLVEKIGITAFGGEATLTGTSLLALTSGQKWR